MRNKQAPKQGHRSRVLNYEELLPYLYIRCLEFIPGNQKPPRLSPNKLCRFKQSEQYSDRLDQGNYAQVLSTFRQRSLLNLGPSVGSQLPTLEDEVTLFLKRFESLIPVTAGKATRKQALWALAVRLFAPWAAARIALHLHYISGRTRHPPKWLFPVDGSRIRSCFVEAVRAPGESNRALARRLCPAKPNDLEAKLRHYQRHDDTPSDQLLETILAATSPKHLPVLVLARAIDRVIQDSIAYFGHEPTLCLLRYFALSLNFFRSTLSQIGQKLPPDKDSAWLWLSSYTFTGTSPVTAQRLNPIFEPYLNKLAAHITDELLDADPNGSLTAIPQTPEDLLGGEWRTFGDCFPPDGIHEGLRQNDADAVIRASKAFFRRRANLQRASLQAWHLCQIGLERSDPRWSGRRVWQFSEAGAQALMDEGVRLFQLVIKDGQPSDSINATIELLRFLLVPYRPKRPEERGLARSLFRTVDRHYQTIGCNGSALFIRGNLLWLEGDRHAALKAFSAAASHGKHSFVERDWPEFLREAPVLAEALSRKRELKRFATLAERFGIFSGEPAPRTQIMLSHIHYQTFRDGFNSSFKEFPT